MARTELTNLRGTLTDLVVESGKDIDDISASMLRAQEIGLGMGKGMEEYVRSTVMLNKGLGIGFDQARDYIDLVYRGMGLSIEASREFGSALDIIRSETGANISELIQNLDDVEDIVLKYPKSMRKGMAIELTAMEADWIAAGGKAGEFTTMVKTALLDPENSQAMFAMMRQFGGLTLAQEELFRAGKGMPEFQRALVKTAQNLRGAGAKSQSARIEFNKLSEAMNIDPGVISRLGEVGDKGYGQVSEKALIAGQSVDRLTWAMQQSEGTFASNISKLKVLGEMFIANIGTPLKDAINPQLTLFVEKMQLLNRWWTSIDPNLQLMIARVGLIASAFTTFGGVLAGLIGPGKVLALARGAFTVLGTAMFSTIGVLALVAGAVGWAITDWEGFKAAINRGVDAAFDFVKNIPGYIDRGVKQISGYLSNIGLEIGPFGNNLKIKFKDRFEELSKDFWPYG